MCLGLMILSTQIYTAEPQVPEPSAFEVGLAIEKLKSHKAPGTDQIPAKLIKAVVEQFAMRSKNLLFLFGRRICLRSGRSQSLHLSIRRAIKETIVIIGAHHFCQLRTKFFQHPAVKVNSICTGNYWRSSMWISMQQVNC